VNLTHTHSLSPPLLSQSCRTRGSALSQQLRVTGWANADVDSDTLNVLRGLARAPLRLVGYGARGRANFEPASKNWIDQTSSGLMREVPLAVEMKLRLRWHADSAL
jgi:hypothetical protein